MKKMRRWGKVVFTLIGIVSSYLLLFCFGYITPVILHHPCPCYMRLVCQCSSSLVSGNHLSLLARIPNPTRVRRPDYLLNSDLLRVCDGDYARNAMQAFVRADHISDGSKWLVFWSATMMNIQPACRLKLRLMHLLITGSGEAGTAYIRRDSWSSRRSCRSIGVWVLPCGQ